MLIWQCPYMSNLHEAPAEVEFDFKNAPPQTTASAAQFNFLLFLQNNELNSPRCVKIRYAHMQFE